MICVRKPQLFRKSLVVHKNIGEKIMGLYASQAFYRKRSSHNSCLQALNLMTFCTANIGAIVFYLLSQLILE